MAAVLAEGTSFIKNAAREPEVVDLVNCLNAMGAKIKGGGTDTLEVEGVEKLYGCSNVVLPMTIGAGTYLIAAAITGGRIKTKSVARDTMESVRSKLQ